MEVMEMLKKPFKGTDPTDIERVEFRTDEASELLGKLGEEASGVLGYNKLLKAAGGTLRGVLMELDIHPLVTSKVEAYKRSKEKVGIWSGHKWATFHFALCFMFAGIMGISVPLSHFGADYSFLSVSMIVVNIISIVCIIGFLIAGWVYTFNGDLQGWRIVKGWEQYTLNGYPGAVPDFVLAKALQIKKAMPKAEFHIDQLVESRERTVIHRDPDPFLIVSLNNSVRDRYGNRSSDPEGEAYYIEVWDEKEYEQTM